MRCQNCAANMRADLEQGVFLCDYCGGEFVPPPEADGVLVLNPVKVVFRIGELGG